MTTPLSRALLAAGLIFAGSASAELGIQPNGSGDAVYIPYYTVQDGQTSLLTISNGSDRPTHVKLLVAEALNGQSVLSIGVYMPPRSTWTGALSQSGDAAKLTSQSDVCTVPNMNAQGFTAVNFDYRSDGNHPDGGGDGIARTQTGSIELIELGELAGELADDVTARDCAAVQLAYTVVNGVPPDRTGQILAPTSRISASLQIITVSDGIVYPVPSYGISGFSSVALDPHPGTTLPRLHTPQLAPMETSYRVTTGGRTLVFAADRGVDAMSALFMSADLSGEYYADPLLGASSRWAISFPTKFAYVHERPGSLATAPTAEAPFASYFNAGGACEQVQISDTLLNGDPLSSGAGGDETIDLCQQVNTVDAPAGVAVDFSRRLDLVNSDRRIQAVDADGADVVLVGLPAVGVQISNFVNGQLQGGVLANYSIGQALRREPGIVIDP